MAKFKVRVTRIDEYEIDFKDNVIDQDFLDHYSKYFSDVDDQQKLAEILATMQARLNPDDDFFEGFGYIKKNNRYQSSRIKEKINGAISISIISEDSDINCESELIEEKEELCQK